MNELLRGMITMIQEKTITERNATLDKNFKLIVENNIFV